MTARERADAVLRTFLRGTRPWTIDVYDDLRDRIEAAILAHEAEGWRPINEAPRDGTRLLVAGYWNERAAEHCRGQKHVCVGSWSSWSSSGDPSTEQWIYEGGLGNIKPEGIAVTFIHFRLLPPPPEVKP